MGSRYLTDLADVCRSAGLVVQEEPGWQSRSRGSGGYDAGRPTHVMIHHTASGAGSDGQSDVNYCCYGSPDEPIANLYLNRAGKVWVMAAGACNTNGSGTDKWGGGVPVDSMNTHAIGIEAANNGTGEPWPPAQQEAYALLVQALQDAYLISANNVREHAEWADGGRKIDPAGPSRWASSGTWNGAAFRNDMAAGWPGLPPPVIPPDEDDMPNPYIILNDIAGHAEKGGAIIVEAQGLRTIGGAEVNYAKFKKWDFVIVKAAAEWDMAKNARTQNVHEV